MSELLALGVTELAAAIARGEASSVEVTRAYLERVQRFDPVPSGLHAYLHVAREAALSAAEQVDRARAAGEPLGPLAGVPIGIKDNLCVRAMPTTCASRILEGWVAPYDAEVIARVRAASGVILGKLNMDEFAMGSSTESSAFGLTRNPWDLRRTPGGSSGGAAAATAARLCVASLGSDTGGSVRQPASYCGVTALKPTYGRVSRRGLVAFASSLDQVGPIARSARDTARLLGVIAGRDAGDATSSEHALDDYEAECGKDPRGLRVGIVRSAFSGCDPAVVTAVEGVLGRLSALGCELLDVELPHAEHAVSVYYLVAPAEASSNLARFDGMRYGLRVRDLPLRETYKQTREAGFGPEVKRRIMLGTYALSRGYYEAFYLKAAKVRTLIARDYAQAFARCDLVVTPTAPTPAFVLGEVKDPLSMYKLDVFTLPPSLAGVPAISAPAGLSPDGLPIGVQLVGPHFREGRLLRVAHALEQGTDFARFPTMAGDLP